MRMMSKDASSLVIACSLTEPELREHRSAVLQKIGTAVLEIVEVKNGYAYRFPSDDKWLDELMNLVRLERQCCPFLTFRITVEANGGAV
jgi:hypothetical protein